MSLARPPVRGTRAAEFAEKTLEVPWFAQRAPQHGASQCSRHWERWGQEAKHQASLFHSRSGPPAHLERPYPGSSVLIRVPFLSAFSAPLREIPGFGNYGIANLLIPESLNSSISTYRFRLKARRPFELAQGYTAGVGGREAR